MSFWKIAWRNIEQRALASSLTGLSMALGVALMILVIVIHGVTVDQFENDAQGYHLIVGGSKGGDLQLVMTTVFHLGRPLYPIPWSYYKEFVDGEFAPYTEAAVPYCLGDSYQTDDDQFRVVATTPDLFEKIAYGVNKDGSEKRYSFQAGENFRPENFFDAVIGATVARRTGLGVGDTFQPTHGISASGDKHTEFRIVGVLAPTGTANDRALFANLEGFFLLEGHSLPPDGTETHSAETAVEHEHEHEHDHEHERVEPLPEDQREVTSILVLCKEQFGTEAMVLDKKINKGRDRTAQAVAPASVVSRLLDSIIGPVRVVLMVLTILIIVVAGISILVSIYNSMSDRRHEIAVMRALGAGRETVMMIILLESILLSAMGGGAGWLLAHVINALASGTIEERTGVVVRFQDFAPTEWFVVAGLLILAVIVGFLPALSAYRTDVARSLGK